MNHFKENLDRLITEQEIIIACMAEDLKVSAKTISGWRNGIGTPRYDRLIEIADYLEVTVDELIR